MRYENCKRGRMRAVEERMMTRLQQQLEEGVEQIGSSEESVTVGGRRGKAKEGYWM